MSTQAFADENCALGSIIENISELERRQFWDGIQAVGIGPCRSCGRCAFIREEFCQADHDLP